jgi:hypothetical protein
VKPQHGHHNKNSSLLSRQTTSAQLSIHSAHTVSVLYYTAAKVSSCNVFRFSCTASPVSRALSSEEHKMLLNVRAKSMYLTDSGVHFIEQTNYPAVDTGPNTCTSYTQIIYLCLYSNCAPPPLTEEGEKNRTSKYTQLVTCLF